MAASSNDVERLSEMFGSFDKDVISSVLSVCDNNFDAALEQLMQMNGNMVGDVDADEEVARAMFEQFACACCPG